MSLNIESRRRRTLLASALAALLFLAGLPAPSSARSRETVKPSELRKVLQKFDKRLLKIEDAMEDGDSGRVGTLLRMADEDLVRFLEGSGLESLLTMLARARQAVGEPEMRGAQEALRGIRAGLNPLSDYVVRRDAEVAYMAATRAVAATDLDAYAAALRELDSAILAPLLMAHIEQAREAIAAGRAAMVGRNMDAGRGEIQAARSALDGLRLAAALSQAVFGLEITSEFIAEGYGLAARDQLRGGARALREALEVAPEELQADLQQLDEDVWGILDRLSKPLPEDPGTLVGALETVEALRTAQQ